MLRVKKQASPVDRAAKQVEEQIRSLERQIQEFNSGRTVPQSEPSGARLAGYFKELLTPPQTKPVAGARTRHDLFDLPDEPLKDLAAESVKFNARVEPDLFAQPVSAATVHDGKFAAFLSFGSVKTYRPLKHQQQANKKRFYIWVGLALAVLGVAWIVVR